jgi:hypothetical protein
MAMGHLWLSPDGQNLAFIHVTKTEGPVLAQRRVMIVNTRSGAARMLTVGAPPHGGIGSNSVAWTPDSKSLIFLRGGGVSGNGPIIYIAPLDGSGTEPLYPGTTKLYQIPLPLGASIALNPDGRRLACSVAVPEETPIDEIWALENLPDSRGVSTPTAR